MGPTGNCLPISLFLAPCAQLCQALALTGVAPATASTGEILQLCIDPTAALHCKVTSRRRPPGGLTWFLRAKALSRSGRFAGIFFFSPLTAALSQPATKIGYLAGITGAVCDCRLSHFLVECSYKTSTTKGTEGLPWFPSSWLQRKSNKK